MTERICSSRVDRRSDSPAGGGRRAMRRGLVAISTVAMVLATAAPARLAAAEVEPLAIGAPAPDFDLPGVDGRRYALADFAAAEVLVVVFTCNHCPTAQAYEERIIRLEADFRPRGVAVVAISPNDPLAVRLDELGYSDLGDAFDDMKLRAEARGFAFPYLYDGETQAAARAYGPQATPHVFVFDRQRRLRFRGRIDDAEVKTPKTHDTRAAVEALLAGQPVPAETTKVVGCSIKWADKRPSVEAEREAWAEEEVALGELDTDGVRALAANAGDDYLLVNVWATHCGPCVAELGDFVTMHRMYRGRPFRLVTITQDEPEDRERALELLREKQCSATNYVYAGESKYDLVEALDPKWEGAIPFTVLIAPGGEVAYRRQGPIDALELRRAVVERLGRTY